ncbi:MAG: nucleotide exchange factor GrpE [Campylobacterales bacterium]|nr:nucleotide exchange factor GrpE [Campylobacterales bacterium]
MNEKTEINQEESSQVENVEICCEAEQACIEEATLNEISSLQEKLKESEDKFLRAYAEFENSRKRMEKDKYAAVDYANESFAKDLLPALDSLELAINSIKDEDVEGSEVLKKLKEGIEITINQFNRAFSKHGIENISTGGEFDPHSHEAVMQVASDVHEEGSIVSVFQKGYRYKDRLLRPAMVSICKK